MRYKSQPIKEFFTASLVIAAAMIIISYLHTETGGSLESIFPYLIGSSAVAALFCMIFFISPKMHIAEIDLASKELKLRGEKGAIPFSEILGVKYPEDTLLSGGEKFMALMTSNGAVRVSLTLAPEFANKASARVLPKPAAEYGFLSDLKEAMRRVGFELKVEEVSDLREYLH